MTLSELFKNIADAIRGKDGSTGSIPVADFASRISAIETEPAIESLNITKNGTYTAPSGVHGYSPVEVNVPTGDPVEIATPKLSIDSATGIVTATSTQEAGIVTSGTKTGELKLTTKAATTITPGTSAKTAVSSGIYTTGDIIVKGDSNLIASNIVSGKSIFGVNGSYSGTTPTSYTVSGIGNNSYTMYFTAPDRSALQACYNNGSFYLTIVCITAPQALQDWDMLSAYIANVNGTWQPTGMIYHQSYFTMAGLAMDQAPYISGNQLVVPVCNAYNGMRFSNQTIYVCTIVKI